MDELIHQFLLRSGYPRAAIVTDATLFVPGQAGPAPEDAAAFAVVDPESAERLAVIDVVGALDADGLQQAAARVERYASRFGGRDVQGFMVRVDPDGDDDAERVQFYRVWPNRTLSRLPASAFPDLDALRVSRRLALDSVPKQPEVIEMSASEGSREREEVRAPEAGRVRTGPMGYLPALALLALAGVDWFVIHEGGAALVNTTQSLLAVGAAALLTATALVRARHR